MEPKRLIAVDDSFQLQYAVPHAGRLDTKGSNGRSDLSHIPSVVSRFTVGEAEKSIAHEGKLSLVVQKNGEAPRQILSHQRENLMRSGVPEVRFQVPSRKKQAASIM